MSIHANKLHVLLAATVLGEGVSAPLAEICACVFDPLTGEFTPDINLHIRTDLKKELRDGRATGNALCHFLLAHKHDMLVFDNTAHYVRAAEAVMKLSSWFDEQRTERGVRFEDTLVYAYLPHSIIPRIEHIHHNINGNEQGIWPSYGVRCSKTIMDLARPELVKYQVDLPVRPPSKNGLADETNHQAIVLMHHLLMLTGEHPEQTGKKVVTGSMKNIPKATKAATGVTAARTPIAEDDDEL